MAKPSLKDGFARVANELQEALIAHKMGDRKRIIAWLIVRLTYGWNRTRVTVSQKWIAAVTGIDKANVSRTMAALEADGLLVIDRRATFSEPGLYGLETDWEKWSLPLLGERPGAWTQLPKQQHPSCQNGKSTVAKTATGTPLKARNGKRFATPKDKLKTDLKKSSSIKPGASPARSLAPAPAPVHGARPPPGPMG